MSAAAAPLAALHPLREPDAIGWWPPAPGWWALAALALVAAALVVVWLLRRHRRNGYRRRGREQLARIRARFAADSDAITCLTATNALLKAIALRAYPQRNLAAANGSDWQAFLEATSAAGSGDFDGELLAPYRPGRPAGDLQRHLDLAERWILRHRVGA